MLKSKNSLGTLAAIAALAATHSADAAINLSTLSNEAIPIGGTLAIDIDNNGVDDFVINGSNQDFSGIAGSATVTNGGGYIMRLGSGVAIGGGSLYEGYGSYLGSFSPDADGYIGLRFDRAGQTHFGWLEVEFTSSVGTILRGAWEDISDQTNNTITIETGAVPEPNSSALIGGLAALMGVIGCQRRRKNV